MKYIIILSALCFPGLLRAQDQYKTIAQETCDCIAKKDLTRATKKEVEIALGLCMLERIQANKIDVDISDGEAMRKFGEQVGMQMAPLCPTVFALFTNEASANEEVMTLSGKVKFIDENEFLFLTVKDEAGKETRLIWLQYFKGSDDYLKDPSKLVGKKVSVKYEPIECYIPKAKGYFNYKKIVEMVIE